MDRPIETAWRRRAPWVRPTIVVAALGIGAWMLFLAIGAPERSIRLSATSVKIAAVTRGVFHDFVPLRAKVDPLNSVYLDALEGGRVEKILAQAGDMVSANQTLVIL